MLVLFWTALFLIFYVIAGYGLLLLVLLAIKGRRPMPKLQTPMKISFLIPAHNEERVIAAKLENTLTLDNPLGHDIEIAIVCDGCTDRTAEIAQSFADRGVLTLPTESHDGKLAAMNWALPQLSGDVVIFSDANSLLSQNALVALMTHFADPKVGGVCGQISVSKSSKGGIGKSDSLFWRYDQALKHAESSLGGTVSAQGSIYAIRRALTGPINPGCADDFVMSVRVVHDGYRLAFEPDAVTEEHITEKLRQEAGRRVRSTEMGWRGLMENRSLLNPVRHGLYAWQLFSHKFLRRLVPAFLVIAFFANLFILDEGWFYGLTLLAQVALYGAAAIAALVPAFRKVPGVSMAMFFVSSNIAMLLGLVNYMRGRKLSKWTPIREEETV
ncbi:MAG: glycosyltransferase family 2 protein [Pseudomonadota bacterium]